MMTPRLDIEDLKYRLYGNGAETWEVEALLAENERLRAVVAKCAVRSEALADDLRGALNDDE